jgi:hypothetical protein
MSASFVETSVMASKKEEEEENVPFISCDGFTLWRYILFSTTLDLKFTLDLKQILYFI